MRSRRVMVVDDDPRFRRSLRAWLERRGHEVAESDSVATASDNVLTFAPDVLLLDFALGDGTAHELLDVIERAPGPQPVVVVISGEAESEDAFSLAARGVRRFLAKPLPPERLASVIEGLDDEDPALIAQARASVGRLGIHEAEALLRRTMVEEALARSEGSRRSAARLLSVSRQALQHMLRRLVD